MAALIPVFRLFMDLKTELTPRLSVSRFLATVLTATCHNCELQFLVVLGLLADLLDNEYGHSSSNRSRSFRCVADSAQHSVGEPDWQHSPPTKLNLRRIMIEHLLECILTALIPSDLHTTRVQTRGRGKHRLRTLTQCCYYCTRNTDLLITNSPLDGDRTATQRCGRATVRRLPRRMEGRRA